MGSDPISTRESITIVVSSISIVIAVIAIFISLNQTDVMKGQLTEAITQNTHLQAQVDELRIQNRIQNDTLNTMKEGLKKESNIELMIDAHTAVLTERSLSVTAVGGENNTVTYVNPEVSSRITGIALFENETTSLDIIVNNVGSSNAFIDRYSINVFPDNGNTTAISFLETSVKKHLKLGGDSITINTSFIVTRAFAPSGTIVFAVYHNSGFATAELQYEFLGENPFKSAGTS